MLRWLAFFLIFACSTAQAGETYFHPPREAAESRLDTILRRSIIEDGYSRGMTDRDQAFTAEYLRDFTPALLRAIVAEEERLVRQDCNGHYIEGDLCGMDYVALWCGQDIRPDLRYHMRVEAGQTWIDTNSPAHYRIMRHKKGWRIDGIQCEEGKGFHAPDAMGADKF